MDVSQLFGSNASGDFTAPANPILSIAYQDLATDAGWDTPPVTDTGKGGNWLLAIIRKAKAYIDTVTDNSNRVTIAAPTISVQTISGTTYDVYSYSIGFRIPRTGGNAPDPDDL